MRKKNNLPNQGPEYKINRKEAIQKVGRYAAFTAATMMVLMRPATSAVAQNSPTRSAPHAPKRH